MKKILSILLNIVNLEQPKTSAKHFTEQIANVELQ